MGLFFSEYGTGFAALEVELRRKLIVLQAISLTPALTWEMELFAAL